MESKSYRGQIAITYTVYKTFEVQADCADNAASLAQEQADGIILGHFGHSEKHTPPTHTEFLTFVDEEGEPIPWE